MPLADARPQGCANAFGIAAKLSLQPAKIKDGDAPPLAPGVARDGHGDRAVKFRKAAEHFVGKNGKNRENVTLSGSAAPFVEMSRQGISREATERRIWTEEPTSKLSWR